MSTPSERTVKMLRKLGWVVERTERDMQRPDPEHPGKMMYWKHDLFNIADYIAFGFGRVLLVQCTSFSNHAKHITKINENPITKQWADNGQETVLVGWREDAKTQPRLTVWRKDEWATETQALTYLVGPQDPATPSQREELERLAREQR